MSLVDAALPMVYVRAEELGADATLLGPELDSDAALQATLEEIRCHGAVLFGMAKDVDDAHTRVRAAPKIAMVAPPATYTSSSGKTVAADQIDVVGRAISMENRCRV